jgi:hypothetical protein
MSSTGILPVIHMPKELHKPKSERVGVSKKTLTILYIVLAVLAIGQVTDILEGYLFPFPAYLSFFIGLPLAALSLLYLIIHVMCVVVTRVAHSKWRPRPWSPVPAVALLHVLWGAPIVPAYLPHLFGYYLRVRTVGNVPAILAWADTYAASAARASTQPDGEREQITVGEWVTVPHRDLPDAVKRVGQNAMFRPKDRAVEVYSGSGMAGSWGVTVGHGIGEQCPGKDWAVSQDAYVWGGE